MNIWIFYLCSLALLLTQVTNTNAFPPGGHGLKSLVIGKEGDGNHVQGQKATRMPKMDALRKKSEGKIDILRLRKLQ